MIRQGCPVCQGDLFPAIEGEPYYDCLQCGRPYKLIAGAAVSAITKGEGPSRSGRRLVKEGT